MLVAPRFKEYEIFEPCIFDKEIEFITFSDLIMTIKAQGETGVDKVISLEATVLYNGELHLYYNFFTKVLRDEWLSMPNLNPFWLAIVKSNPIKFLVQDPYHKETLNNFIQTFPKEFNKFLIYLKMFGYDFTDVIKKEFHFNVFDDNIDEVLDKWQ